MAESFVQVAPDSTGKLLRTETTTTSAGTVHQEVITLADSAGNLVGSSTTPSVALQTISIIQGQTLGATAASTLTSLVPAAAVQIETSGTTSTGAQITASIPALSAKTSFLMGFDVTLGAGTAGTVTVTVTGLTNQLNYVVTSVATTGNTFLSIRFPYPLSPSSSNSAVTVTVPSTGGGSAVNAVNAFGFQN